MKSRVLKLNLQQWAEKGMEVARLKAIDVCLEAAEGVIDKTPVDTGFCRSMWSAQINALPNKAVDKPEGYQAGAASAGLPAEVAVEVAGLTLGDRVWIYNPTVYAPRLENGHSKQAPAGMVAVTLAELRAKYA